MAEKPDYSWIYTILPLSAVGSGLSIIIPIYILDLGGTVFDVGVAFALYSLISIPASILWGKVTDDSGMTKELILLSLLGTFPIIAIMYLLDHVATLQITYALFAFVATAASPAINIMLMGEKRDPSLPKYFSRYSIWAIGGTLLAFLPGYFVTSAYIKMYLVLLLLLNLSALVLALTLIRDRHVRTTSTTRGLVSLFFAPFNMLTHVPNVLTTISLTKRIHETIDGTGLNGTAALLVSVALFSLGMNLFNTSYIPFLRAFGLSYSNIFSINIFNAVGQVSVYAIVLLLARRIDLHRYYHASVFLRCACYLLVMLPLFFLTGAFFYVNILAYVIGGFAYALWNVTASVMIYDHIRGKNKGYYVGLWVAIIGASTVLGAFGSGVISAQLGYMYTFVLAIAVTLLSVTSFIRARLGYYKGVVRV